MAHWFRMDGSTVFLSLHAQPGARLGKAGTRVQGMHGDALKIRVAAPPVDGRANEEIMRFLAEKFDVPLQSISILGGASSRLKRFQIVGSRIRAETLLDAVSAAQS
jgi:uncharacterized protein (TIGR00251 family)